MTGAATALTYAALGWYVFPLKPGTKDGHYLNDGHRSATNDLEQVTQWWEQYPDANIGLNLAASGLIAVDPDIYKPGCEWNDFIRDRELPETLVQTSARGGKHYIFTSPPGDEFAGKLCNGVDIKRNGYVVVAPSTFEGKAYRWDNNNNPAPVPDWVPRKVAPSDCGPCPTPAPYGIDIDALPVSDEIKFLIRNAPSKRSNTAFDRSSAIMQAMNVLRHHVTREQCISILSDPANGISEKAREKRNPSAWLWDYTVAKAYAEISPERIFGGQPVALPAGASPVPIQPSRPEAVTTDWTVIRARPRIIARPLIEGILAATSVGMLYGAPKAGKTFVTLDMCLSLAAGINWNGQKVKHHAGPVIYVAGEGHKGLRYRVEAWELDRRVQIGPGRIRLTDRAINFGDAAALLALKTDIDALPVKPSLIVIDTLFRATVGANVSDQEQMSKFWQICEEMQRHYNCTVLVVHHTNKSESSTSFGSIVSEASVDFQIAVELNEGCRCIRSRLTKDDSPFDDIYFDLKSTPVGFANYDDGGLTPVFSCVPEYTEAPDGTSRHEKAQARRMGNATMRVPRGKDARTALYALARIEFGAGRGSAITKDLFIAAMKDCADCVSKKSPAHWIRDGISPLMRDGYVVAHEGRDDAWRLLDGAYEIAEEANFDVFENYEPKL